MAKTCRTCIHQNICDWNDSDDCPYWQKIRYTGKWIKTEHGFRCSECGEEAASQFSYCPDCGASMMYEVL